MNLPFVLDVAIGLIFIYLILSLLASEIQELLTTLLQWRAKHLKESIENLLSGGTQQGEEATQVTQLVNRLYNDPLLKNINQEAKGSTNQAFRSITWGISNLYQSIFRKADKPAFGRDDEGRERRSGPSYISSETFATTLMETLGVSSLIDNLVQFRLKQFTEKIINGITDISNRSEKNLEGDKNFQDLQEEVRDIVNDFNNNEATLLTSIDRLAESIDRYTKSYPREGESYNEAFINRVQAFKSGLFGEKNERAIVSGGLKPSLHEIVEALNTSSSLYQQISSTINDENTRKEIEDKLNHLPKSLRESLAVLARRAQTRVQATENTLNQFREEISIWFDRSMNRASGVYKRNAKGVALLIGFFLAIIANADTFHIFERLSNDENLRKVITDRASQIAPSPGSPGTTGSTGTPMTAQALKELKRTTDEALRDVALPIGWNSVNVSQQFGCPDATRAEGWDAVNQCISGQSFWSQINNGLKVLFGWLTSGIAISMGAPFWFDLLGKVVNVRNSGSKPASHAGNQETPEK